MPDYKVDNQGLIAWRKNSAYYCMLALLCSMHSDTCYAQNYASIIYGSLVRSAVIMLE